MIGLRFLARGGSEGRRPLSPSGTFLLSIALNCRRATARSSLYLGAQSAATQGWKRPAPDRSRERSEKTTSAETPYCNAIKYCTKVRALASRACTDCQKGRVEAPCKLSFCVPRPGYRSDTSQAKAALSFPQTQAAISKETARRASMAWAGHCVTRGYSAGRFATFVTET